MKSLFPKPTSLFLFGLLLSVFACTLSSPSEEEIPSDPLFPTIDSDSLTYLALGDSYTIGQGVAEEERWPNQLASQLATNNVHVKEVNIIARTGWTTRNLLDAMDAADPGPHDLVSLLIGVNNQYQGIPVDTFKTQFEILLQRAIELAGGKDRVFVVSIPDYGVTPFGSSNSEQIGRELDGYNTYTAERCAAWEIPFIYITEISRILGNSPGALAGDQLHPSGSQYTAWTEEILPVVLEMLEE